MNVLLMYTPSGSHFKALQDAAPNASFKVAQDEQSAARLIKNTEVVLGNRYFLQSLPFARKLKWMQSNSMGVDLILENGGNFLKDVILTCARGVYDHEVTDHALAMILALYRGIHDARDLQNKKEWKRIPHYSLKTKRALVLGWGGVGKGIAVKLKAFVMEIEGVRRQHCGDPYSDEKGFLIWGPDRWRERLPYTDILILALPKTKLTLHIVSDKEIFSLRHGSYVVNIGRGGTLEELALKNGLSSGHLNGAALDVFENEPLPQEHWIWNEKKILMTPHWARSLEKINFKWEKLFEENLNRYISGKSLLNVVDKDAGY